MDIFYGRDDLGSNYTQLAIRNLPTLNRIVEQIRPVQVFDNEVYLNFVLEEIENLDDVRVVTNTQ